MVATVKVPVVDPAAMVISVGTNATVPVVHNSIAMPPLGAAALRVTVPVDEIPEAILGEARDTEESDTPAYGVTVRDAALLTPFKLPVMLAEVG